MIKLKKQIQSKQSGMTAIMLAMFLAIVISLLAVGFATLVRKDQAETLDKTLSYQAQYAAESGVNKIISYIDNNASPEENPTDCSKDISGVDPLTNYSIGDSKITCGLWSYGSTITVNADSNVAQGASFKTDGAINIKWSTNGYPGASTNVLPPSFISNANVLAITLVDTANLNGYKKFYIVPTTVSGLVADVNFASSPSGSVHLQSVSSSPPSSATIGMSGFDSSKTYGINISLLNPIGSSTVDISGNNGFTNLSQYKIDVNAKTQDDITKRVVVTYNKFGAVGPNYAVNVGPNGSICKDYVVGATGGHQPASEGGALACPGSTP